MSLQYAKSYSSGWKIPEMFHEVYIYLQNSSQIPQKSKMELATWQSRLEVAQTMIILSYNLYSGDEND